jgi:multidrug efflux pump subunit AcrA (membrane-fusion protein)
LLADRELMTVESPADGIVYYGKFVRGRPGDSEPLSDAVSSRGSIPVNQVVMTVVQPRPMWIRATAPENQLSDLRPGLKGIATPTGYPDLNLPVTLDDVSDIPVSPGNFNVRLTVGLEGKTKLLMPGMTCKVKLVAYLNRRAITVAPKSLMTDELDDQDHSVQVLEKDGKTKERPVTVGRKTDKQVEIVKGLSEGDQVVIDPVK